MLISFQTRIGTEKALEEVIFPIQAREGLIRNLHGRSDATLPAGEAPVFVEVGVVAERGGGGVGFKVYGFYMDHVQGGAVGGDYEGADVAAHCAEGDKIVDYAVKRKRLVEGEGDRNLRSRRLYLLQSPVPSVVFEVRGHCYG